MKHTLKFYIPFIAALCVIGFTAQPSRADDTKPLDSPLDSPIHMTILAPDAGEVSGVIEILPAPAPAIPRDDTDSALGQGGRR